MDLDKLDVVKAILVNLSRDVERWHKLHNDIFKSSSVSIDHYYKKSHISGVVGLLRSCETDVCIHGIEGDKYPSPKVFFITHGHRG